MKRAAVLASLVLAGCADAHVAAISIRSPDGSVEVCAVFEPAEHVLYLVAEDAPYPCPPVIVASADYATQWAVFGCEAAADAGCERPLACELERSDGETFALDLVLDGDPSIIEIATIAGHAELRGEFHGEACEGFYTAELAPWGDR